MRALSWLGMVVAATALGATTARADRFKLTSPDLTNGGTIKLEQVFNDFGCKGNNISPALSWTGVPAGAKSLALTVFDRDAPTGSGFWHWVIFDIPAGTTGLPKDAGNPASHLAPQGAIMVRNDFSLPSYDGPCPPTGDKPHHYTFTLFAVDQPTLPLNASVSPAVVGFTLHFHTIAKTTLTGRYGR